MRIDMKITDIPQTDANEHVFVAMQENDMELSVIIGVPGYGPYASVAQGVITGIDRLSRTDGMMDIQLVATDEHSHFSDEEKSSADEPALFLQIRDYVRLRSELEQHLRVSHQLREFLEAVESGEGWTVFARFLP